MKWLAFDATLSLDVNTTNQLQDLGAAGTLSAGIYVRVHADGSLIMQAGTNTGFWLDGTFDLEVGTEGLIITTTANLKAKVAGTTILNLGATGALLINASGIAAKIALTAGTGSSTGGTGFSFGGAFVFELNTTSQAIAQIKNVTVNLAAGPSFA
jgi:hypothetical protein